MISYQHIRSVTYYLDSSRDPARRLGYYTDAASEPPGRWWSPAGWQAEDGAEVRPIELERLASYRDTETGRSLPGQRAADARAATDYSFSSPKAFSALWAVSDQPGRERLEAAFMDSVRDSLSLIHEKGMIEARRRRGGRNGDIVREAVEAPIGALYLHHTSREGDPQIHCHALLMNAGRRADGTIGAVNNERLLEARQLLDATFTRDLARRLEAMGVRVEPSPECGFRIAGQPDDLIDQWSSRRKQIVEAAAERGIETRDSAAQAQVLALGTRGRKADVQDRGRLEERWLSDRYGRDRDLLMSTIDEATGAAPGTDPGWARLDRPAVRRTPEEEVDAQVASVREAIERMQNERSWWRRDQLGALAIRLGTGRATGGDEAQIIDTMIKHGALIEREVDGRRLVTTPAIIQAERQIVSITQARTVERDFFTKKGQQAALADDRLSGEQHAALEAMLSGGGIVAVQGGAGVGKTMASAGIRRACEADGKTLIVASPEWRAAGVLASELGTDERYSVDRIINQMKSGKLKPDQSTVILIDEAGKMHRDQAAELLSLTQNSGARIIFVGDTRQMAAVRAGDPLDLIAKSNPAAEIRQIRRQRIGWMREASMAAQQSDMAAMLKAYNDNGRVRVENTKVDAVTELALAWRDAGGDAVALAATNKDVTAINGMLRETARDLGLVTGPDAVIQAVPRGKNAKAVPLALATGDRLIAGAALKIGNEQIENGTIFNHIEVDGDRIALTTDAGRTYETTVNELGRAGRQGKPPALQHAYALTDMSSQGSTWSRTLWMPTAETSRAAYVAATRHRDDLQVFVSRESVRDFADGEVAVGRQAGLVEGEKQDNRSDGEILAQLGRSLGRRDDPRNALDVFPAPASAPERARAPERTPGRIVGNLVSRPERPVTPEARLEAAPERARAPERTPAQRRIVGNLVSRPGADRAITPEARLEAAAQRAARQQQVSATPGAPPPDPRPAAVDLPPATPRPRRKAARQQDQGREIGFDPGPSM